jgi:hypothetical protein
MKFQRRLRSQFDMDLKLLAGLGFIGAGMIVVVISQFVTIGSVLKFPLIGP